MSNSVISSSFPNAAKRSNRFIRSSIARPAVGQSSSISTTSTSSKARTRPTRMTMPRPFGTWLTRGRRWTESGCRDVVAVWLDRRLHNFGHLSQGHSRRAPPITGLLAGMSVCPPAKVAAASRTSVPANSLRLLISRILHPRTTKIGIAYRIACGLQSNRQREGPM